MGFLDKAKKLAGRAQTEEQGSTSTTAGGPIARYDQHGRPSPSEKSASPPHGDPLLSDAAASSAGPPTPGVPATEPRSGPPAPVEGASAPPEAPGLPGAPPADAEDRTPKRTGGDPLAG